VNIDPPGAIATSTFGINDAGAVVGAYRDSNNVLHGFQRSTSGSYSTIDFPGAGDSQLTGINNRGHRSGVYDLGDLGSTKCPGPQCQAVSFLLRSGAFTAFEVPQASPQATFALSINDRDQICGLFRDASGNTRGFLRNQSDGSFRTLQFPLADTLSWVNQISNQGVMAGEYSLRITHGFLTDGSGFFSFDYPDSDASGLRAVNSVGEVGGYFVVSGSFRAFLATPHSDE
jgi:hypothetical protein